MKVQQIIAVVLIALGIAALVYGGVSYTSETHEAVMGPVAFQLQEKEHIQIPNWLSISSVIAGTLLLLCAPRQARK